MIRRIGLSVLTQVAASASSFVVSLLLLRLLSFEDFGHFVYLFIFSSFAGSVAASMTGTIYQLLQPRYQCLKQSYERAYNGLNLIAMSVLCGLASVAADRFGEHSGELAFAVILIFTVPVVAWDNLKLQAGANGQFKLMFALEVFRQGILIASVLGLALSGQAALRPLVLAHGLTGVLACLLLAGAMSWRPTFKHLPWVVRRHYAAARYLLPSTVVGFFHATAIQLLIARHFGLEAVGLLRAAELPYSAINPLKQSINFFLPRAIFELEKADVARRRSVVVGVGAIVALGILTITLMVWVVSIALYPWLTHKEYPASLGILFAVAYVFMMLLSLTNHYLNVIGQSRVVFRQTVAGAVVAIGSYVTTFAWLGAGAAPLAILMSFFAMTAYGLVVLNEHLRSEGGREARTSIAART